MIDLGDLVQIAVDIADASGTLVDPSTAILTITKPDGTIDTPTVPLPPAETGKLRVDYLAAAAGRYSWRMVTTIPNTAYTDSFDVREAATPYIVSLADAKTHLGLTSLTTAAAVEQLRSIVEAVSVTVEDFTGPVVRRALVQRVNGSVTWVMRLPPPVISVESIDSVETTTTYATAGLIVDTAAGIITRTNDQSFTDGPWDVSYTAGRPVIPAPIRLATLIGISDMWETQRGREGAFAAFQSPETQAMIGVGAEASQLMITGAVLPPRAMKLLRPYQLAGVA